MERNTSPKNTSMVPKQTSRGDRLPWETALPNIRYWGSVPIQVVLLGTLFGLAYVQEPLYTSNQNTKFLHGLARGGLGYLQDDWLAQTIDPLPTLSGIVELTYRVFNPAFFYVYFILLIGLYAWSALEIGAVLFGLHSFLKRLVLFTAIIIVHCLELELFDIKTHVALHSGVAEQYLLGHYFQPSVFGVLLLASVALFLRAIASHRVAGRSPSGNSNRRSDRAWFGVLGAVIAL